MKLDVFLNLCKARKKSEDKEKLVKERFKNEYIPISKKIAKAKDIVEKTYYNNNQFVINSVDKYIYSCMSMIELYTDIEFDGKNIYNEFDKLNKIGFFDLIFSTIDDRELKEYNMILDMTASDAIDNEEMK